MFIHRNDSCYCQSGEKYKNCCLERDRDKILEKLKPEFKITPFKIQLFPSGSIKKCRSAPYYKYAQELWEKEKQMYTYKRIYKEFEEGGYADIHGVTYAHYSKNGLFPIEVYEKIKKKTRHEFQVYLCNFIAERFRQYLEWNDRTQNYMFAYDFGDGKDCMIELTHRFHKKYTRKVKRVMDGVKKRFGNKNAFMMTLDVSPAHYNWDLVKAWTNIRKDFHDFMEACRLHIKREKRKDGMTNLPKYIATIEPYTGGKNKMGEDTPAYGFPHIHIVFLNAKRVLDWRKLNQYWHVGGWKISRDKGGKKIHYPINYITKYVTKTFTTPDKKNLLPQALVWFFGLRSYTNSRDTTEPVNGYGSRFEALCMVRLLQGEDILDYMERVYWYVNDVMKVGIDT